MAGASRFNEFRRNAPGQGNPFLKYEIIECNLDPRTPAGLSLSRGMLHLSRNEPELAIGALSDALDSRPTNSDLYFIRANARIMADDIKGAISDLSISISLANPPRPCALLARGWMFVAVGSVQRALSDFSRLIGAYPGYGQAYLSRGSLYQMTGERNKALADFSSYSLSLFDTDYRRN